MIDKLLNDYKEESILLRNALMEMNSELIDYHIDNRQNILTKLNECKFDNSNCGKQLEELGITSLENEIYELFLEAKQKIKNEIDGLKLSRKVSSAYEKNSRNI